jgi:hypothetical protein
MKVIRVQDFADAAAKVAEAAANVGSFNDVIKYYNAKVEFFYAIQDALDLSREDDYEFFM